MNRVGRYDRGEQLNARWFSAFREVQEALADLRGERVLEIGCGTGLTTVILAREGRALTAIDASPEMLVEARKKVDPDLVTFIQANMYEWGTTQLFDTIVFTFVLSHVQGARFEDFWQRVGALLLPGGEVFIADSMYSEASTAVDHELAGPHAESVIRRLNDRREFRIAKVFHEPEGLAHKLRGLGWRTDLRAANDLLYFGTAEVMADDTPGPLI